MSQKRESRPGDRNYNYRLGHSHEGGRTREYAAWASMKQRCTNERNEKFKHYGGRGINFYPPWGDFSNFLTDMGPAPDRNSTLERKDVDKNYGPDNCVWAPWADQRRNKRLTQRATIGGITKPVICWCEEYNICTNVVYKRMRRGWSVEESIITPIKSLTDPRHKK